MTPDLARLGLLFAAGFAAGTVNSVAGGGSLITYPALVAAGIAPVAANGTNTVALVPGSAAAFWGYRDTLDGSSRLALSMALPSAAGGAAGALLALRVGDERFAALVPWLVLGATALFALQGTLSRALRAGAADPTEELPRGRRLATLGAFQFVVAFYGGFFGAGIGILMLAALGFLGVRDVHRANGLKNLAAVCINGVATAVFVASGVVAWVPAAAVALGAVAGGYGGAGLARRAGQRAVRAAVLVIGLGMAAALFVAHHARG